MSDDDEISQQAPSVQDNDATNEEDSSSSVFSDLEPPPAEQEVENRIPDAPEPQQSPGKEAEEKKDDFDGNGNEERISDHDSTKVEEDVEEGKIQQLDEPSAMEETGKPKPVEPSPPLVHVGSNRDVSRRSILNGSTEESETSSGSNRKLMIAGFCLCLFLVVIVQGVTLGLVVSQNNSDKETTSDRDVILSDSDTDSTRIPTLRPTTVAPSVTPTQGNVFESIANTPGSIRLNQVSFCDECTEYISVNENHLPWNDWTYVTEFEVNSNGYVNLYCWNYGTCGMIEVVALNLSPNVQGSIYMLWEEEDPRRDLEEETANAPRQFRRKSTLTISFEEVMLFGFFDDSPYQVNAQVKISEGEITICYGDGNFDFQSMRAGFYNYTDSYNFQQATGFPFDRNGYASTFPKDTCQTLSSRNGGGDFVPTVSPTYYWYTSSPTQRWSNWYPTSRPTDWYYRTSSPTIDWSRSPTPNYYETSGPTWDGSRVPTPTNNYFTSSPTSSPTFEYFFGFQSIAYSTDAQALDIVSNCDDCSEATKFESFPYVFRGRDNIWEIHVSSNGYLELIGDCESRICAVINVVTTDLDPSASNEYTIWTAETADSYIYSFEYVPIKSISSSFEVEEDDAGWMIDDDFFLNRLLQGFDQGNVSAQVYLYFDGQIDICWGDMFLTEYNHNFTSSIDDFVEGISIPANGYYFDEKGATRPSRFPSYTCQTLLAPDTGPSPKPTTVPSSLPTDTGSSDKWFVLNQNFGELDREVASWILRTDTWTLPMGAPREMYMERYILAMLYFNTDLLGWSNQAGWLSSSLSVCEWAGIICNRDMRVQEIDLAENNLSGSVPWELGRLDYMERISLDHNRLQDGFMQLSALSLSYVSMRNATLTGTIPTSFGYSLTRLTFLDLAYNNLSGTIPQEMFLLKDLKYLNLGNQYFYGTIPLDVGFTTQLEELHLAGNALSGTIPSTINYLNRLGVFDAGENQLTGQLPYSMFIDMTSLRQLHLDNNYFTGTISPEIAVSVLEELELHNNQLTGEIPTLPQTLTLCNLSFNRLQATGDTSVCEV